MFCSQCGSKLDSKAKFCPSCGSPVSSGTKGSSGSQKAVVSFGSERDERWDGETDIALWVANIATSNLKTPGMWGKDILEIYRRALEGTPRWESFTELLDKGQSQLFELLKIEDLRKFQLPDVLAVTLHEASFGVDDPKSRLRALERWLDCRDWQKVSGVTSQDRGRLEFARAYMYSLHSLATNDTFLDPLYKSLNLGFGPAAFAIAEDLMYSQSDLRNAITALIAGKEVGSTACAEWLEDLEDAPGEYSGTVSDEDGNEEIVFVSFNAGGFGTMPDR